MKLIIGNKNYSTWSLRPWLLLTAFDLEFEEVQESLLQTDIKQRLGQYSPTCRVPVLVDDQLTVWDSLAICEYICEHYLQGNGWPQHWADRAKARAVCAEMHAGFMSLRNELPMNCRATRKVDVSESAKADIARIDEIWSDRNNADAGPWLFGQFSIADCFYAPVALRFKTYGILLSDAATDYQQLLLDHDALKQWVQASGSETEVIPEDEAGCDI